MTSASAILSTRLSGAAGTNEGGFWLGSDGRPRYVKLYPDPCQAHCEVVANAVYRSVGLGAPRAVTFDHSGRTWYASEVLGSGGYETTIGARGLTPERARRILDGFAADVLLANRDVLGMVLDNVIEVDGRIVRIDNGSALLFHGLRGRKPESALAEITTEWHGFAPGPGGMNRWYAEAFIRVGMQKPEDLGAALVRQIDDLSALESGLKRKGGWAGFVRELAPALVETDRERIVHMLEVRMSKLPERRARLAAGRQIPVPAAA